MLNLSSAHSKNDRISFYTSDNGVTAIRDKNNKITFEYGKRKVSLKNYIFYFVILLLSIIKSIILLPLIDNNLISTFYYLIPTFICSVISIIEIIYLRKNGGKEFLKNHGAEHMVFEAYLKLKRLPTIDETLTFSRISKYCGISLYSAFVTGQIIAYIVYISTGYIILETVLFIVPLLFSTFLPFNLIGKIEQFFTTSKPELQNIELAMAALSKLENL